MDLREALERVGFKDSPPEPCPCGTQTREGYCAGGHDKMVPEEWLAQARLEATHSG